MPREPFHPLFGALEKTPVLAEIQATQEYLGQAKHLVYLGTMWQEFLDADTLRERQGLDRRQSDRGRDPSVPRDRHGVGGEPRPRPRTGADITSRSRTGTRPAGWRGTPACRRRQIAEEWTRMTFTNEPKAVETIRDDDDDVARDVRELHDAARAPPSDRREPLRADARERQGAARRLDGRPTITRPRRTASASTGR